MDSTYRFGQVTFVAAGCTPTEHLAGLVNLKTKVVPFDLLWEKINSGRKCESMISPYFDEQLIVDLYNKDIKTDSVLYSLLEEGRNITVAVNHKSFEKFVELEYDELAERYYYELQPRKILKAWQEAGCPLFWNPAKEENNTEEECRATKTFERFEESENLEGNTFYTWQFASYCDNGHNQMMYDLNKLIKKGVIARVSRGFYKILHPKYEY